MDFVWNDGGRAAAGFVGSAGDCVTRAIAIATGKKYRTVYDALAKVTCASPRNGVVVGKSESYLHSRGWERYSADDTPFDPQTLPDGIVIVQLHKGSRRSGHMCTVIDHVVHDTWNAAEDDYCIRQYWTHPDRAPPGVPSASPNLPNECQNQSQKELDRVIRIVKALERTAGNQASTDAEKRNAVKAMQEMMLSHNLSREDLGDDETGGQTGFARVSCPVNGRRACGWEKDLAHFVCDKVMPTVGWYKSTKGHRTIFQFYGPPSDVETVVTLFRELLLTIASNATLLFGGYSRQSGAEFAEEYVEALESAADEQLEPTKSAGAETNATSLMQVRALKVRSAAREWLAEECGVRLSSSLRYARDYSDPRARELGRQYGSNHKLDIPRAPKRITHRK